MAATLVDLAATLVALVATLVALVATLVAPLDVILLAPSTVYGYRDPAARLGLRHQLPLSHRRPLPAAASPATRRRSAAVHGWKQWNTSGARQPAASPGTSSCQQHRGTQP